MNSAVLPYRVSSLLPPRHVLAGAAKTLITRIFGTTRLGSARTHAGMGQSGLAVETDRRNFSQTVDQIGGCFARVYQRGFKGKLSMLIPPNRHPDAQAVFHDLRYAQGT